MNPKILNCLICGKEHKLTPIIDAVGIHCGYWAVDAVWDDIQAGYGSDYDCDVYEIIICDEHVPNLIKTDKIKYNKNIMFPEQKEWSEAE